MTQKELKALYTEELKKAWSSESMVKHCSKTTAYVIEHNGELYGIEKPTIETSFCFGSGFCGVTTPEEENRAEKMASHAKRSQEYFISENLREINHWINRLNTILEEMGYNWAEKNHPVYMIATGAKYYSQTDDCKLRYFNAVNTFENYRGTLCNDEELIKKLITGYEAVKESFIKRLNTYLKKYGLSKVKSWTYISD